MKNKNGTTLCTWIICTAKQKEKKMFMLLTTTWLIAFCITWWNTVAWLISNICFLFQWQECQRKMSNNQSNFPYFLRYYQSIYLLAMEKESKKNKTARPDTNLNYSISTVLLFSHTLHRALLISGFFFVIFFSVSPFFARSVFAILFNRNFLCTLQQRATCGWWDRCFILNGDQFCYNE